jgi:hypothetical protein
MTGMTGGGCDSLKIITRILTATCIHEISNSLMFGYPHGDGNGIAQD